MCALMEILSFIDIQIFSEALKGLFPNVLALTDRSLRPQNSVMVAAPI